MSVSLLSLLCVWTVLSAAPDAGRTNQPRDESRAILATSGIQGGLVVHLGCGDGQLTAALWAGDSFRVHGLDADAVRVAAARQMLRERGLYGPVSVDQLTSARLPYIDNLVNLLVAEDLGGISQDEVLRVLCPGGVACLGRDGQWTKLVKPRPPEIDDWSHYLHSASNNAVSQDTLVGPPRRLQWVGSPLYSRHHDRMSSVSAVVSAGGRVFTIFDEATPASILVPPKWALIARDAFNGTILWKRGIERWHTHLWPLKSGPAQLPRRLVASDRQVYVTLSLDGPLLALDAASGETVRTYAGTAATEEILLDRGTLFLRVNPQAPSPETADLAAISRTVREPFYDEQPRQIMALEADTGRVLWTAKQVVLPGTLAAGGDGIYFHDGQSVVALERETGAVRWRSEPVERQQGLQSMYMPTLVVYGDVILFSGKGRRRSATAGGSARPQDELFALAARSGAVLWHADHPPSGYQSPEDVLVAGGLVWCGETTGGSGIFTGRDPQTGEVKAEFPPDTDVFWFHHRCYRGKATENYLLMSRTGTEFVDFRNERWLVNHWVRGACLYGVMPANGLLYAPQHPCACYLETKLSGFNALAPAAAGDRVPRDVAEGPRLERGPAYDELAAARAESPAGQAAEADAAGAWSTFRADNQRSGRARTAVDPQVTCRWQAALGGRLTSPVVAGGRVFVACLDTHTVHALDTASGQQAWSFTAGGAVDSPPTVYAGRVLFGSADGYLYCLRASDGQLAWRFLAAPLDQRLMAFEQLQSVWPVHGSVLVQDGVVWCVAGRSVFLDSGLRLWRLEPRTGRVLSQTVLDHRDPATGQDLHSYVSWLNMPVGLPDVLSCDGRHVYMRSQTFALDGTPRPLEVFPRTGEGHGGSSFAPPPNQDADRAHLFSPTGFLDDSWWHRTYWLYGSRFYSGWSAYYLAGKVVPAGRILVFDDAHVYGFGRKPQYYRWTTPIEHHLFAADKKMPEPMSDLPGKAARRGAAPADDLPDRVQVPKSDSLNPAGKPLTIEAWIKSERAGGVVLAHGGHVQGYALYLRQGRPHFTVRAKEQGGTVAAAEAIVGRWCHLAGVLTPDKQLALYVDGQRVATGAIPAFVSAHPMESVDIGADSQTSVADDQDATPFAGQIDEVRLYHRALTAAELSTRAGGNKLPAAGNSGLVLAYSFDDGTATDESGQQNHGKLTGAKSVEGRSGRALSFSGAGGGPVTAGNLVSHPWSIDLPLMPRAILLAGDVLFLAGPPDLVDEEQAARTLTAPETQEQLGEHAAALAGQRGATLWAVSAADGQVLAQQPLEAPPRFDGLAAADGKLFLVTSDGKILCFGSR
jgi:outer membrane protein assembly factor BamB